MVEGGGGGALLGWRVEGALIIHGGGGGGGGEVLGRSGLKQDPLELTLQTCPLESPMSSQ